MDEAVQVDLIKAKVEENTTIIKASNLLCSTSNDDYLGHGAYGVVTRVRVPIGDKKFLELAYKKIGTEGRAASALRAWIRLRKASIPVPPTFRLVETDGKYTGVLMTDLTNGWKDILITSNPTKAMIIERVKTNSPSTVKGLAELDIDSPKFLTNLDNEIASIAQKAAGNKIKFAHNDVVSAVYTHTGMFGLIISDMDNVFVDVADPYENLLTNNYNYAQGVLLPIREAHRLAQEKFTLSGA